MNLTQAIDRCDRHVQGQFDKLPYERKVIVRDAFERHRKACEKTGVEVEPSFVPEAIAEAKRK